MTSYTHQILPSHANRRGRPPQNRAYTFTETPSQAESIDTGIYVSNDGARFHKDKGNHKRRRIAPSQLEDPFADWTPMGDVEDAYYGDDDTFDESQPTMPGVVADEEALGKRKRYLSSVSFSALPHIFIILILSVGPAYVGLDIRWP